MVRQAAGFRVFKGLGFRASLGCATAPDRHTTGKISRLHQLETVPSRRADTFKTWLSWQAAWGAPHCRARMCPITRIGQSR